MNVTIQSNAYQFYLVYSLSAFVFFVSLIMFNPVIVALSAGMLLLSVMVLNSGHILNDFLIRKSGIIEMSGQYSLSPDQKSLSKRDGNQYKSISIAILSPRKGAIINQPSLIDMLDSISEQFEFSIGLKEVNKGRILENLNTKLRMKEIALSRLGKASYDKINSLKRQIDLINGDIASMSSGGKSFEFIMAIKSLYTSADETEARFYSAKSIESLVSKFSAAIAVDCEILTGEKLLIYAGA